ncbi:TM2 domain-containing protein [Mesoflavibacter zeaxanthinifaciens]|uniref:TM2 domain-containing protein n=1 Tax=Mesoflavibacter zeaxanthinifaciens TaxID=393060 RepID=UPI0026E93DF5|nr:TM2 domain-containing protein [Mesoflavibacter zeaxanthinifaciens]
MDNYDFSLAVQQRLKDFSATEKKAYLDEYNRKKKSVFTAYLLLIPLGWHYAYLKKWGLQVLCFLTLWGFLLWWFIDWFRVPSLVKNYNKDLSVSLLNNFNWVSNKRDDTSENTSEIQKWLKNNPNSSLNDFYRLKNN